MNIKNLVLLSLLTCASFEMNCVTITDLGYAGAMNATAVFKWAKSNPEYAYYALQSGLQFNDAQDSQLKATAKGYIPGSNPVTPPVETGPTEAEKQAAEAAAQAAAHAAAQAEAQRLAAEAAAQAAAEAARRAEEEAARLAAEAEAAKQGQDKKEQEHAGDVAVDAAKHADALKLVQEIANKVNQTPYSGNLKAALVDKAPVSAGTAHRSKTLGRLGKDKVQKDKKSRVKTRYQYA